MNTVDENIISLSNLEDGWNFGDGNKIRKDIIEITLFIRKIIDIETYNFIEAFPLTDGGISLRIGFDKENVIGLLIYKKEEINAYYDNNNQIIDLGVVKLSEIKKFINLEHEKFKVNKYN